MSNLTAIDILVDPDVKTIEHAHAWNARVRQSVPDGFALDDTHQPHITTLQRYVRTAELDELYDVVEKTVRATDFDALSYQAVAIRHADWAVPGRALAVILVQPNAEVLDFQASLLAAVTPFVDLAGNADAFVRDPGEEITRSTLDWVEGYVPGQVGQTYIPHITVGFAALKDLDAIEAAGFETFTVHPASLAVYHLGNNGTARKLLKTWPIRP